MLSKTQFLSQGRRRRRHKRTCELIPWEDAGAMHSNAATKSNLNHLECTKTIFRQANKDFGYDSKNVFCLEKVWKIQRER